MQYSLLLSILYMFWVEKLPETCRALTIIMHGHMNVKGYGMYFAIHLLAGQEPPSLPLLVQ